MIRSKDNIVFLKPEQTLETTAATGVSLHCHTLHSREVLDFVPYYAKRTPVVSYFFERAMKRHEKLHGKTPDFINGFWLPPLAGDDVVSSEKQKMASLGLGGIVSITDHDRIDANLELNRDRQSGHPVSMEWTVPFENAYFHIGVHNLPLAEADSITNELLAYTYAKGRPDLERLKELFAFLNEMSDVLIVLNHPIWDIEMIGQTAHEKALANFLTVFTGSIHALEINGFRSWAENAQVVELADLIGLPLVSGGDRHCCQANTVINVTDATDFAEFANEIRRDKFSRIAVMPEYHVSLPARQLTSIAQILGHFPQFESGRQKWTDRVFIDTNNGRGLASLTEHWNGSQPIWTYLAFGALRMLGHRALRPLIDMTVGDVDIGRSESQENDTQTGNYSGYRLGTKTAA